MRISRIADSRHSPLTDSRHEVWSLKRGFILQEDGYCRDTVVEPFDPGELASGGGFPHKDLALRLAVGVRRRGKQAAISGEHEAADRQRVPLQHADGGAGSKVPEPDRPDLVAAGERPAVGAHGQGPDVSFVAVQRGDLTCRALPEHMPGEVTRVVLARVRNLVVQDILSTFKLAVLDRLTGQAKLRSVKMPVSQPSVAVGEVGIAVGASRPRSRGPSPWRRSQTVYWNTAAANGDSENQARRHRATPSTCDAGASTCRPD